MSEDNRACGCQDAPKDNCQNGGLLSGLFRGCGCGCGDNGILFFIIVFLLLFTNCGCCNN